MEFHSIILFYNVLSATIYDENVDYGFRVEASRRALMVEARCNKNGYWTVSQPTSIVEQIDLPIEEKGY